MGRLLKRFLSAHTVTVELFEGTNGRGKDTFGPPVTATGFLDSTRRTVLAADGAETISESTFYTTLAQAPLFNQQARVTIPGVATPSRVIRVNAMDTAGIVASVEHAAISLT